MPKSLIIQTIVGFAIAMIAFTLFAFSIFRMTLSTEYSQIATDGTITITPEPERSYYITLESTYEVGQPDLERIHKNLIITSNDPLGGFSLTATPGHSRSSRTTLNTSTHRASVAQLTFTDNDPITLNISSGQLSQGQTLLIRNGTKLTMVDFAIALALFLIGIAAASIAGTRVFIWTIKSRLKNTTSPSTQSTTTQTTPTP